ncbi:MAG: hypothetical protein MUF49_02565 [Oculatellaceae cyanobacterium Prado106]|jgi:hypothetical protein|nr:hypothetical protein [Oculatellaceae cyanobacterium Prado106]
MTHPEISLPPAKVFLTGAVLLILAPLLLMDFIHLGSLTGGRSQAQECDGETNGGGVITRQQLAEFLTISERDTRSRVEEVLPTAHCQLPGIEARAGATAERKVYLLDFNTEARLIVLYEGDEYAGFQFLVQ